ncbi:Structural maintenance of chromosomes protein 6 [Elasticomyces elasticus]|nr:Structural maintenance of chromosomes protein 6 [Elasticomyces elasticus]
MVPGKRMRAPTEDSDFGTVSVEAARSELRQAHSKRQRLSGAPDTGDSVVSDDEESLGEYQYNGHEDHPNGVRHDNYDTTRDAGFEDLDYEEEDDVRATQLVARHMQQFKENKAADQGIIEEVTCINFMCHTKLKVKLGPLINFIIGHNGSGKSAVLTALTLCLGAKATSTNRGGSLKSFIKEGQDQARVIVKIKNEGDNSYQPEVYGSSISVERHFNQSGTSGFKIKNSEDKIISTKRAELEDITDFFGFQLDNPMNVLTQDMARQFLSNSTPELKYKFFIRGTQLEQLDRDYKLFADLLEATDVKLHSRARDVEVLERKKKEAERRKNLADRSKTFQNKVNHYTRMHAWAQVEEQEKHRDALARSVEACEQKVQQVTAEIETASQAYEEANRQWEVAGGALNELQEAVKPSQDQLTEEKGFFDTNKDQLLKSISDQRQIGEDLKGAKKLAANITKSIEQERQRLEGTNGGDLARKLSELEDAKVAAEQAKNRLEAHGTEIRQLELDRARADDAVEKAKPAVREARDAVRKSEDLLQQLQQNRGQQLAAFHRNMPALLRAIQNDTRFSQKPVGPVGQHVRLLKPEWSSILETTFGGMLESFLVVSKRDQSILSELMRKTSCESQIYIGDAQPIDVSHAQPDPAVDTIMRVIEVLNPAIDSDLVRNQLIINQAIEQTVLIRDYREATGFLYDQASQPQNVRVVIAENPNQNEHRGMGIRYTYTRGGARSSGPVRAWPRSGRMKTDVEAQIRLQREGLQQVKLNLQQVEAKQRDLELAMNRCKQATVRHARDAKELQLQFQRAEEEVERLQDEIEQETPQDGRLDGLKEELAEAEASTRMIQRSYEDGVVARDKLNETARDLKRRMDAIQREVDEGNARILKAEKKIKKLGDLRQARLQEKNLACQLLEDANQEKTQAEERLEAQNMRIENEDDGFIVQATAVCPRVPVESGMTATILDNKLEKLRKDVQRVRQELGGTHEELVAAHLAAHTEAEIAKAELDKIHNVTQQLKRALLNRQDRWRKFRRFITSRARIQFIYLLSERDFRGKLRANHKEHWLDINVCQNSSDDSGARADYSS